MDARLIPPQRERRAPHTDYCAAKTDENKRERHGVVRCQVSISISISISISMSISIRNEQYNLIVGIWMLLTSSFTFILKRALPSIVAAYITYCPNFADI